MGYGFCSLCGHERIPIRCVLWFINWYLSGFVGGYLNRQGYYSAVPSTAKQYMEAYEWDYWMLEKAAAKDIMAPDGKKLTNAGEVRDGGSFETRMGGVCLLECNNGRK